MRGTVVCGVGTEQETDGATRLAAALAARLGLRLVLVHVSDGGTERTMDALESLAGELDVAAEARVVHGHRVDALVRAAAEEGADAIVLGSGHSNARGRQMRCRFAREVEAATAVPVLIAPPTTRERSRRRLALAKTAAER